MVPEDGQVTPVTDNPAAERAVDPANAKSDGTSEAPAPASATRPAYAKPSITRHGNLRMMTQLE